MGFTMSRSARITLLLVIDVFFFFVELIVGYAVGSLALVADSFHMLNDVLSLVVALYAIKLTAQTETDSRYSYGWHRAEILAALVNGVFLLALCFSISLEAIGRFFSTPEISNPKLIVIVGSLGLASNLIGLLLFHEHGHSHGHSHEPSPLPITGASPLIIADEETEETDTPIERSRSPSPDFSRSPSPSTPPYSNLYNHPAARRASIVRTAHVQGLGASSSEATPLLDGAQREYSAVPQHPHRSESHSHSPSHSHSKSHSHSHSHGSAGSMNMRALVLHVLGDALGNVGVISTGLVIWLSQWSFKFYFDPVISLIITVIIFSSAMPLVRSASFILLQGVPPTVSLDEVREAILEVDGVLSLHELHIWQLSETKIVASVHVLASSRHNFMPIASKIRKALHHHGIHSCTIQPEYVGESLSEEEYISTPKSASCLILCPEDQECNPQEHACCPPPPTGV